MHADKRAGSSETRSDGSGRDRPTGGRAERSERAGQIEQVEEVIDLAVEVFRMLADGTRVRVLQALLSGELSVTQLAEQVGKAPASVSQHLAKLRMARLVRTRRDGTTIFYRLDNDHVARLITDALHNAEHAGPGVPAHHRHDPTLVPLDPLDQPGRRDQHDRGQRPARQQSRASGDQR